MSSEPEITTMGAKGQVVIPKAIRDRLELGAQSKFVVYAFGDTLVMKKLSMPDVSKELEKVFRSIDRKDSGITEEDVDREIQALRNTKREQPKKEGQGRR